MSYEQQRAAESLYRDANSLVYADHKPDDEAVDRVIHKLNMEYANPSPFMVLVLNIPCVFLSLDKTNATSSHESASTKTKAISRTSTSAIVCSTKRYLSLTHDPLRHFLCFAFRLPDTTTNIRRKSVPVSSVVLHCEVGDIDTYQLLSLICVFYCCFLHFYHVLIDARDTSLLSMMALGHSQDDEVTFFKTSAARHPPLTS